MRHGYLPRSFCTLDELREDADEQLFFLTRFNPNQSGTSDVPQSTAINTMSANGLKSIRGT